MDKEKIDYWKQKLQGQEQRNTQKYLQAAFEYVNTQNDIGERWKEVLEEEKELMKDEKKKS